MVKKYMGSNDEINPQLYMEYGKIHQQIVSM